MSLLWRIPCAVLGVATGYAAIVGAYLTFIFGRIWWDERFGKSAYVGRLIEFEGHFLTPNAALFGAVGGTLLFVGLTFGFFWLAFNQFRKKKQELSA